MSKYRELNNNWKGGKRISTHGYVLIRVSPDHHLRNRNGYAYEHRMVAEQKLGRKLISGEQTHHINGIKTDNRPENIVVTSSLAEHLEHHRKRLDLKPCSKENPMVQCACGCGKWFYGYDDTNRPRKYVSGHNPHDLTKQCHFIEVCGNGSRLETVSEVTGQSIRACKCMASKLVAEGKLQRIKRGLYGKTY